MTIIKRKIACFVWRYWYITAGGRHWQPQLFNWHVDEMMITKRQSGNAASAKPPSLAWDLINELNAMPLKGLSGENAEKVICQMQCWRFRNVFPRFPPKTTINHARGRKSNQNVISLVRLLGFASLCRKRNIFSSNRSNLLSTAKAIQ